MHILEDIDSISHDRCWDKWLVRVWFEDCTQYTATVANVLEATVAICYLSTLPGMSTHGEAYSWDKRVKLEAEEGAITGIYWRS